MEKTQVYFGLEKLQTKGPDQEQPVCLALPGAWGQHLF